MDKKFKKTDRSVHMDRDLTIRWILVIAIMGTGISGISFGIYLTQYVATTVPEKMLSVLFTILVTTNAIFNAVGCYYYICSYGLDKIKFKKLKQYPRVAVVMPARNEDGNMVKRNLESLTKLDYPKDKINFYLIDNSTKKATELEKFCGKIGV